jgi:hypothetical protein
MGKFGSLAPAAGLTVLLLGATIAAPSAADPVVPNGLFSFSISGPYGVDTVDIKSTTTSLVFLAAPKMQIESLLDPYLGLPNNFCGRAGAGCSAPHTPGFLGAGDGVKFGEVMNFPVDFAGQLLVGVVDAFTAAGRFVQFGFDSVVTTLLTPTTSTAAGRLSLTVRMHEQQDDRSVYATDEKADMTLSCTQPAPAVAISCSGIIDTPILAAPPAVPEPASATLLGFALLGFAAARRRRTPA